VAAAPTGPVFARDAFRLLRLDGRLVKWGSPELGSGAELTYAILDSPDTYSGTRNCKDTGGVEPLLSKALTRPLFERELSAAFAMWSHVADIRFDAVRDAESADILIGAQTVPRGLTYADVALVDGGSIEVGVLRKGVVCINPEEDWAFQQSDQSDQAGSDIRYALAHEIGHLLGLDHPGAQGTLMSFAYEYALEALQPGDIAGILVLYGPVPESGGARHALEYAPPAQSEELLNAEPIAVRY
jgi:hypothetical protein